MKRLFLLMIMAAFILSSGFVRAEEYYSWTDENGNVHMGNAPSEAPKTGAKVKKYEYNEAPPEQRKVEKRRTDYNARVDEANRRREDARRDAEYRAAQREKEYYKSRCENARLSESRYRYNWRNARTDRETMYWKEKLDEIELICSKVK